MAHPKIGSRRYERETAGARTVPGEDPVDAVRRAFVEVQSTAKGDQKGIHLVPGDGTIWPLRPDLYTSEQLRDYVDDESLTDEQVRAIVVRERDRILEEIDA